LERAEVDKMAYGVYEKQADAENNLAEVSNKLQQNVPLRIDMHGNRVFLVPAGRAHYDVCDDAGRPMGTRQLEHWAG
jgi:hypothetical protein